MTFRYFWELVRKVEFFFQKLLVELLETDKTLFIVFRNKASFKKRLDKKT